MIHLREALATDAEAIRDIFVACYGADYPYPQFRDVALLTKLIYSDDTLLLVAEDSETGRVLGTASVILEVGAFSDLVGEFGRLAVHPDARQRGVGKLLMHERLARVRERLHVGLTEARIVHPFTLKIAEAHDFRVVGFLPQRMLLSRRESLMPMVRYFGGALELRKNHPRIVPEAYPLSHLSLENCGLMPDAIVDEESPAYPAAEGFDIEDLTTEGYAALLRIERGRTRHREIFGPLRLHYGFFKLAARRSRYLIARDAGRVVGAIGFMLDANEKLVEIFELISVDDQAIHCLLGELERRAREEWGIEYIDVEVSAYAPRMQRTLLEIGFLPAAYIPALAFHEVERLDVLKMVRLLAPLDLGPLTLSPAAQAMADVVLRQFTQRSILPRIALAVGELSLFGGLSEEQTRRLASVCTVSEFAPGQTLFREATAGGELLVIMSGEVEVRVNGETVGKVTRGECLGELSLLTATPHHVTAVARTGVEAALLTRAELVQLVRQRPDIGVLIYRNLAVDVGQKLLRSDATRTQREFPG